LERIKGPRFSPKRTTFNTNPEQREETVNLDFERKKRGGGRTGPIEKRGRKNGKFAE